MAIFEPKYSELHGEGTWRWYKSQTGTGDPHVLPTILFDLLTQVDMVRAEMDPNGQFVGYFSKQKASTALMLAIAKARGGQPIDPATAYFPAYFDYEDNNKTWRLFSPAVWRRVEAEGLDHPQSVKRATLPDGVWGELRADNRGRLIYEDTLTWPDLDSAVGDLTWALSEQNRIIAAQATIAAHKQGLYPEAEVKKVAVTAPAYGPEDTDAGYAWYRARNADPGGPYLPSDVFDKLTGYQWAVGPDVRIYSTLNGAADAGYQAVSAIAAAEQLEDVKKEEAAALLGRYNALIAKYNRLRGLATTVCAGGTHVGDFGFYAVNSTDFWALETFLNFDEAKPV